MDTVNQVYQEPAHFGKMKMVPLENVGGETAVSPPALLEHVALAHMIQAEQQGVSLTVTPAPDLLLVSLGPEWMIQVLGNLVRNVLRFTPAAGSICLQAQQQDGNSVTFSVQDSGSGIAPEDLPLIGKSEAPLWHARRGAFFSW